MLQLTIPTTTTSIDSLCMFFFSLERPLYWYTISKKSCPLLFLKVIKCLITSMRNYKINGLLIVINSHYLFTKLKHPGNQR